MAEMSKNLKFPNDIPLDIPATRNQQSYSVSFPISNESNSSVLFQIKTNRVGRYNVKPSQGVVSPKSMISVVITLESKDDIQSLIAKFNQGIRISIDKFLILEAECIDDQFKSNWTEEMLNSFWQSSSSQHNLMSQLVNINMTYSGAIPVVNHLLISSEEKLNRCIDDIREQAMDTLALNISSNQKKTIKLDKDNETISMIREEMIGLNLTYQKLIKHAINLTGERDQFERKLYDIMEALSDVYNPIGKEKEEEEEEEGKEDDEEGIIKVGKRNNNRQDKSSSEKQESSFNFAQVLVVITASFFIGRLFPLNALVDSDPGYGA